MIKFTISPWSGKLGVCSLCVAASTLFFLRHMVEYPLPDCFRARYPMNAAVFIQQFQRRVVNSNLDVVPFGVLDFWPACPWRHLVTSFRVPQYHYR